MQLRRSRFLRLAFQENESFDVVAFLSGTLRVDQSSRIVAQSGITKELVALDLEDVARLESLSETEWRSLDDLDLWKDAAARLDELASSGVILTDRPRDAELLGTHERLRRAGWHPSALATFLENQRLESEISTRAGHDDILAKMRSADADADRFVSEHGPPPPAFFETDGGDAPPIQLVESVPRGPFWDVIARRRTCRSFTSSPLPQHQLADVLKAVFGCQGIHRLGSEFISLQKTSPSGGSLHPIEAFPIVLDVEGLEPGIYHYRVRQHALAPIRLSPRETLGELVVDLAQGQAFVEQAQALVAFVARFERNMWKYQDRLNTYHVIWSDLGHLAQTFQLVATALDLGSFYTGALNPAALNEALRLDPTSMGALALCGLGQPNADDPTRLPLEPFDIERG